MARFHYYTNAERERTQGLAYKDARKLRKPKTKNAARRTQEALAL